MHDDQLRDLLRTLEDDRAPDPGFSEALYRQLQLVADDRRPSRAPFLLFAAAALLTLLVAGLALGSGLLRLPETVEATSSPLPSASELAVASPSGTLPASGTAAPSAAVTPSAAPDRALPAGTILFAEADGLRIRAQPSDAGEVRATIRRGQLMAATGAHEVVADMSWYEVRIGPGDLEGWVAAGPARSWLRRVDDGAVTFACTGCGESPSVVSVTPLGDDAISTIASAEELSEWRWSPDGTRLVGARGGTTLPYRIVTLAPDGAVLEDLGIGIAPAWSPDGSRLAWLGDGGLVVTDEALEPAPLELDGIRSGAALWSPDGSLIAFGGIDCPDCPPEEPIFGDPPSATWIVAPDGAGLRQLTSGDYSALADWSPDGRMLAFGEIDLSGEFPARAYLLPVDGGDRFYLAEGGAVIGLPSWSPDGARLAYATTDGIVIADGQGGSPSLLGEGVGENIGELRWSPSGAWLIYTTSSGREPTLWILAADGSGPPRAISPAGVGAQQIDWQPILVPLP